MTLNDPEKNLLTLLGKDCSLSKSRLQHSLHYRRISTVSSKIASLRKAGYIRGPFYHINLNAVGENRVHNILTEIRFDPREYDSAFELITSIDCWEWIFPTMQGDTFFVVFRSNYYAYLTRLLSIIQHAGFITYEVHSSQNRWFVQNPDFFGEIIPPVSHVFDEVAIDLAYPERTSDTWWRFIDLQVMQYLQVKTCNISEIQRIEKRVYGRFWRRSQIKYSIEKICSAGIAERKHFNISPFPWIESYGFLLLVEGDPEDVVKFLVNFGQDCRLYKAYTMCRDMGFVWCVTSPQVGPELMNTLGGLSPQVQVRCLQLKSVHDPMKKSFNDEHFDIETQRWIFPFAHYKEQIKTLIEKKEK
ncbi:MAG: Lrp/AsnC family transcriptional regulator [Theionarchaea archaeon]|nr:Lrp/AsnC family transcriptional regulator [Theionarchaea archaeon]MBU7038727.1 Lrp/AsnC family transcriptional regulator [Theionarchaea archaeon]